MVGFPSIQIICFLYWYAVVLFCFFKINVIVLAFDEVFEKGLISFYPQLQKDPILTLDREEGMGMEVVVATVTTTMVATAVAVVVVVVMAVAILVAATAAALMVTTVVTAVAS